MPVVSREIVTDCLAVTGRPALAIERLDGELHQYAKADPRVRALPGAGEFMAADCGNFWRPTAKLL